MEAIKRAPPTYRTLPQRVLPLALRALGGGSLFALLPFATD
ncbi:MAG TPA: hypothetical protein VJ505_06535 [Holophagaceae bacterium]|nr:hypothetical protein [Holophagaceae bacterium]